MTYDEREAVKLRASKVWRDKSLHCDVRAHAVIEHIGALYARASESITARRAETICERRLPGGESPLTLFDYACHLSHSIRGRLWTDDSELMARLEERFGVRPVPCRFMADGCSEYSASAIDAEQRGHK
jgi:hypothetical protein